MCPKCGYNKQKYIIIKYLWTKPHCINVSCKMFVYHLWVYKATKLHMWCGDVIVTSYLN